MAAPPLRRIAEARQRSADKATCDRFLRLENSAEVLYAERTVDMNLCESHAVLDWREGKKLLMPEFHVESIPAVVTGIATHYHLALPLLPASVLEEARARWGVRAVNYTDVSFESIQPCLEIIYIYTLENPPIYKELNTMLANKNMWEENHPTYRGFHIGCGVKEKLFDLLLGYANVLIISLFLLNEMGMLEAVSVSNVGPKAVLKGTNLYRGLPEGISLDQDTRSRFTAFTSTTRDRSVAEAFGVLHEVTAGGHCHPSLPGFFDISYLSLFPEEAEVLMLPGLCGSRWFGNSIIHQRRCLVAKELLRKMGREKTKPDLPLPELPALRTSKCLLM